MASAALRFVGVCVAVPPVGVVVFVFGFICGSMAPGARQHYHGDYSSPPGYAHVLDVVATVSAMAFTAWRLTIGTRHKCR